MRSMHMSEVPPATTAPRLVFDNELRDEEIPQFLRKTKPVEDRDQDEEGHSRGIVGTRMNVVILDEMVSTSAVQEPEEQAPATDETERSIEEPDDMARGNRTQALNEASVVDVPTNLDEVSVEDLQRQQEELARKIEAKKEAQKLQIIEQIKHVVETYQIPVDELVEALGGLKVKRKGIKAVQKYQDPKTGATWSGRGKEPAWIRGKKRERFLIPE